MEPGDVMALLITILLPTAFLLYLARRYFSYKEKKLDVEMSIAAEKAAQSCPSISSPACSHRTNRANWKVRTSRSASSGVRYAGRRLALRGTSASGSRISTAGSPTLKAT